MQTYIYINILAYCMFDFCGSLINTDLCGQNIWFCSILWLIVITASTFSLIVKPCHLDSTTQSPVK